MELTLTLKLGNAAMQTGHDVADALSRAADYMSEYYPDELTAGASLSLLDVNGNYVGKWEVR